MLHCRFEDSEMLLKKACVCQSKHRFSGFYVWVTCELSIFYERLGSERIINN